MKNALSLFAGVLFAIGLVISGMTNPQKVIGFLDLFGSWDPSLAFVMGGAVITNLILFPLISKLRPNLSKIFSPTNFKLIDYKLIAGSALFGIGWGITGVCPGPGIVNLVTLETSAFLFIISMSVGMILYKFIFNRGFR